MIFRTSRRQAVAGALLIAVGAAGAALAQQAFFRIGTGGTGGTYYPIGGLIANAISGQDGGKGVAGLVSTAVASNGSVANVNAIQGGSSESGFTQSDVAYWAYTGTGLYEGKPKVQDLRLIATLYPETVHIVARKDANIKSVADLKGKRVSIDEPGSGTIVDSRLVLAAFGITEKDIKPEYLKPGPAGDRLQGQRARRVLLRRRLSDRGDLGARHLIRDRARPDYRSGGRQAARRVQVLREGYGPGRRLQGRAGDADDLGQRAMGHERQAA